MARGRYLSLEEARKAGKLEQFAKEHPSVGDAAAFDALSDEMITGRKEQPRQTSGKPRKSRSKGAGTSTQGTSED